MVGQRPILVSLPSPFTDDGEQTSEVRFARALRWHVERGASGFVVGADAGEWWSLSLSERKTLLEWAIREARGVPVYAHCTAWTTAAMLDLAQSAQRHGATGVLLTSPPFPPLTKEECLACQNSLKRYLDIPFSFVSQDSSIGHLKFRDLGAEGLEQLAFSRLGEVSEGLIDEAILHPAAVFGADRFHKMSSAWVRWKMRLGPLFKAFGPARISKAVFRIGDLDLGSPRPPLGNLPDDVFQAIRALVAEVDSSA